MYTAYVQLNHFFFLQYSEQELNNGEQHGKRSLYTLFFPHYVCIIMFPLLSCALGALVKKILETKKDYETSTPSKFKVCTLWFQYRFPPLEGSVDPLFYVSLENSEKVT